MIIYDITRAGRPVFEKRLETSLEIKPGRIDPVANQTGSIRTGFFLKFKAHNSHIFPESRPIGHEESENQGPEASRIIISAISTFFVIKCEKEI